MTILKPTAFHIGRKRALDAQAAAFVYIYARIPQIAEIQTSFYATHIDKNIQRHLFLGIL
jgi:hypothetical protein